MPGPRSLLGSMPGSRSLLGRWGVCPGRWVYPGGWVYQKGVGTPEGRVGIPEGGLGIPEGRGGYTRGQGQVYQRAGAGIPEGRSRYTRGQQQVYQRAGVGADILEGACIPDSGEGGGIFWDSLSPYCPHMVSPRSRTSDKNLLTSSRERWLDTRWPSRVHTMVTFNILQEQVILIGQILSFTRYTIIHMVTFKGAYYGDLQCFTRTGYFNRARTITHKIYYHSHGIPVPHPLPRTWNLGYPPTPRYWHLVASTSTRTVGKRVVRILLECFLVIRDIERKNSIRDG